MKKIIYFSMLFIGCHRPIEPAYVLIITGQSNATTFGLNLTESYTKDISRVRYYDSRCNCFVNQSNGGFEMQAGANFDSNIYTIKVAKPSQPISVWADTAFMFLDLKNAVQNAFKELRSHDKIPVVLSTIWLQGESDIQTNNPNYQNQLSHFIDSYMGVDPALKIKQFVMVKVRQDQIFNKNSASVVNIPFDNIAKERSYCKVIDPMTIGAELREDHAHYTAEGYIKIADAWSKIIKDQ